MKTKTLHFKVNPISRNKATPDNAVAACAYRSGLNLTDAKTGQKHSYAGRNGVLATSLFAPENCPAWMQEDHQPRVWERFGNEIERAEDGHSRRADAQLAKDFHAAAPRELTHAQNWHVGENFVRKLTKRGLAVAVAFHETEASDSGKNPHFHFLVALRQTDKNGFSRKKERWLDSKPGAANPEMMALRREYYACVNAALADAGVTGIYYDPEKQEDKLPGIHKGKAVTALERKGIETEKGRRARQVQLENRGRPFFASLERSAERYFIFEPGESGREKMHNGLSRMQEYAALGFVPDEPSGAGLNAPAADSRWQNYVRAQRLETERGLQRGR